MANERPSNAPELDLNAGGPRPEDGETVAAVMSDDDDDAPRGGGLMGADGGGADAGTAMGKAGAATPNSPIDAELPLVGGSDDADELAEKEAQTLSLAQDRADE